MRRVWSWLASLGRIFLMLVVFFMALGAFAWWFHLPMGEGPAGPPVPAEPFQRVWHDGKVLLVAYGDSIMTGFGSGQEEFGCFQRVQRTPAGDAPDMIGKDLSHVFPRLQAVSFAENSTTSGDHLDKLALFPVMPPDVLGIVMLSTGGIDLIHDYGRSPPRDQAIYGATYPDAVGFALAFRGRLNRLLDGLRAKFPGGCHIFINNIFDPTDGVGDIENVHPLLRLIKPLPEWRDGVRVLDLWNRQIAEAAAEREFVHLVDIHSLMLGHGLHCRDNKNPHYHPGDPSYWYFINLEDPNRRGYDAVRRAFLLEMVRTLAR